MDFHTQENDGSKNSEEAQRLVEASAQIFSENRELSCMGLDRCLALLRNPAVIMNTSESLKYHQLANWHGHLRRGRLLASEEFVLQIICDSCLYHCRSCKSMHSLAEVLMWPCSNRQGRLGRAGHSLPLPHPHRSAHFPAFPRPGRPQGELSLYPQILQQSADCRSRY